MTFKEMQDEVEIIIRDDSLFAMIPGIINNVYEEVVNDAKPPVLKTPGTASTVVGQSWTNIPSGSFGSLLYAGTTENSLIVKDNLESIMEIDPQLSTVGDIEMVALEGNILWYWKQPSVATTLVFLLLKRPATLVLPGDIPPEFVIPEYLHRKTLVYGAAATLWAIAEEGVDGEKVNSKDYLIRFEQGKTLLREWIGKQRKHLSRSVWWY